MTDHSHEPVWVGMDVDAELARYAAQDRRPEEVRTSMSSRSKRSPLGRTLRAAVPSLEGGGASRSPLAA